jgi:hypothetical protein
MAATALGAHASALPPPLPPPLQMLAKESATLEADIRRLQGLQGGSGPSAQGDGHMLTLALNSLQRMHAVQTMQHRGVDDDGESDEPAGASDAGAGDAEDDDDDDPFFMPMPGAVKWAAADKFKELAAPLAEQPGDKQFMILVDQGVARRRRGRGAVLGLGPAHAAGAWADGSKPGA